MLTRVLAPRIARLVGTLLVVSFVTSLMLNLLPGDPARQVGGAIYNASPAQLRQIRHATGLDKPFWVQWLKWTYHALQGDLGTSYRTKLPAVDLITSRLPVTLELMIVAQVLALTIALAVAPLAASKRGSWFDRGTSAVTFGLLAVPNFVVGLLLIYIFAVHFSLFPATGWVSLGQSVPDNLRAVVLPAVALAAPETATYIRLLRAEMIRTLGEDFVGTARYKGLSEWRVVYRHALRPSTLPLVTIAGLNVAALIGGSIIVETLFALPGVGRLAIDSILGRDFITVQAIVAFVTVAYVVVNFLVDMLYLALDPRLRNGAR